MSLPKHEPSGAQPSAAPAGGAADGPYDSSAVQAMIDAVDALVVVARSDGALQLWNARCEDISGVPLSDVAGRSLWDVLRLRWKPLRDAQTALDQLVSGEVPSVSFHSQWIRKDRHKTRIAWTARLVPVKGKVTLVLATGHETTHGRQVARQLEETEARFAALMDLLPDPIVIHQDGLAVFVNQAALHLYGGQAPAEILGKSVIGRVAPESRPLVLSRIQALGQGEAVPFVVERHLRMDGTPIDVEVAATPVTFDGRPAVELVVRDLSIRKASEAALRESEARVRAIFDESSLGMMLLDPAGHALESNRALQQLLGYSAEELAAMTAFDYTHPADRDLCDRNLRDLFAGNSPSFEMEKRCLTSGGAETWTRVHVSPVREPSGPIRLAVGMVEDISDHKLLEDQLRQASKMEALGRLAGGVAHDFNNLLTVVSGYADLLSASLEGDERAADVMEIRTAAGRAVELTSQLLAFGRRAPRTLERIDLNSRIGAMIPMLRRLLGEDVRIEVALDPRVGAVEVDPSQFDQVVMNLVVNARDAMPGGGKLELNTARLEQPSVAGARRDRREWARIEVADSGFGIAPEVMDHIFEPFFTTKEKGRGTGLGLAMVYGIVQQMGGQVRVESGVGTGARFLVDLPLSARPVEKTAAEPSIAGRQGSETILLVEDEAAVREFCRRALESEGYRVVTAGPEEALAEADKLGRDLDLLVTDVVMPGLDGPTIAAALRASDDSLEVLFMSGYPRDREEEMRGPTAGGAVLIKPFTAHDLCDAVRRALDRGAASDRAAASPGSPA